MELDQQELDPVRFGKFELVEQIGHGGMATVHRAFLRGMGGFKREVVIKRILPDLAKDEHFIKMFIEEAKLSALLDHPNIVQVYDFGVIEGSFYIAMEYIDGVTLLQLRRFYRRRRHFPPAAAALIMHQACLGLDYTHRLTRDGVPLGLVHRDVSPSNIMISAHGEVKLLDFGIAKAVDAIDDELTRTGTLKGKWSYMSPEQVVGAPLTARSDIFAAGTVLWEILVGRRLFKDRTDYLTLSNVAQAKAPTVSSIRPNLPPVFDEICSRALSRDPEDRYPTAEEMADHIWTYLATHPCTSSHLATVVAPLLEVEPAEDVVVEVSGSGSASISGSSSNDSAPDSRESFSSLVAGEAESLLANRRAITIATGILVAATLVIVAILIVMRPEDQLPPATPPPPSPKAAKAKKPAPPKKPPEPLKAKKAAKAKKAKAAVVVKAPKPAPPPEVPAPPEAPAPAPEPKPPEAVKAPEPSRVVLDVVSSPAGALVRLKSEKKPRGKAPLNLALDRSEKPVELVASLPGYRPISRSVVPDHDQKLTIELVPLPKPPEPAKPKPAAKPLVVKAKPPPPKKPPEKRPPTEKREPRRPGTKKKVPDLKSGDLADPYGN